MLASNKFAYFIFLSIILFICVFFILFSFSLTLHNPSLVVRKKWKNTSLLHYYRADKLIFIIKQLNTTIYLTIIFISLLHYYPHLTLLPSRTQSHREPIYFNIFLLFLIKILITVTSLETLLNIE